MYEGGKLDNAGAPASTQKKANPTLLGTLGNVEDRLNFLEGKVEQIANNQAVLLQKLDGVSQGMDALEKNLSQFKKDTIGQSKVKSTQKDAKLVGSDVAEVKTLCEETVALLKSLKQEGQVQRKKIEGIESSVSTLDKVLGYVGEAFRSSKIVEFILNGVVPWRKQGLLDTLDEEVSKFLRFEGFLWLVNTHEIFKLRGGMCFPRTLLCFPDDCPPCPAPFEHRIVSAKQVPMGSYYEVKPNQLLGGGRFGQVHKCAELSSGLTLAAKIIKVKGLKEKVRGENEIGVMNQLNHVNLIQLYDAFESRTNLTLIMEYVEGGELFDRIVDEHYQLTELDAIVFTRQICEGVQYLHQQYILHLDLKPENILCVSSTGNQIKIIDFGLARKYRPREKLKVVNYDFVSFPTDMWSVGVITYMLLSGLSPFLGESDTETMNNILHANWDFDADAFENVSDEAKDFISRLLLSAKCSRLSASGCMKHSWLNNLEEKAKRHRVRLKSQMRLQSYLAAHRQWKKHFYAVAAANRLKRFQQSRSVSGP
uniref:Myosin light chain kinase 3 n=1 Tax=Astyanax mexicanus TaxID=7994 RepID=A0A3B1JJL5_ASTMX